MVAKVEDCFLGKEHGFGGSKLLGGGGWGGRWSQGGRLQEWGVRDGDAGHGSGLFYGAGRSGEIPTWTSHQQQQHGGGGVVVGGGYSKGLQNGEQSQGSGGGVRLNALAVPESVTTENDGILTSFVSSYLMAQSQAAVTAAAAQPGRANTLAPGSLARNPSFESITSGSCSTPSFCEGSPVTVFPSRPSDSGSKDSANSDHLLGGGGPVGGGAYSESRLVTQPRPQLSDHYLSTDSLSYGSMEDRDAIVNCVDDFWSNPHMVGEEPLLPEFRFEPMLDDTAMSFSVGELDSLVSTNHGPTHRSMQVVQPQRGSLASMIQSAAPAAPDFCQSFFAGTDDGEKAPIVSSSTTNGSKPTQLTIPAKASFLAAFNANSGSDHNGGRLRWSDEPWSGGASCVPNQPATSLAGSSPSSPTTPLDPQLFATQTPTSALSADEIQKKLTEFSNTGSTNSNKRSFATMAGEKEATTVQALRGGAAPNADKFDAAALSALLYNNTQSNPEFRSAYNSTSCAPPAPKQRRRHGTATDPQSIAARTRREKFTDRIRVLQSLVPNGERLDTVHMLSQTFEYVRFLQHKVWDLYNGKDSLAEVQCEKWKEFVDTATGQVIV
ncbi:hypothetical protein M758_5G138600 [Ceratodon purpureus]|uniref:BHLH domain-containing protein n=1 Tax=Ceratodon purpureus TaxID=3225 RepID=A0A8T0I1F8_CERPU|nr:hypothetical protein KC19_5G145000 [Ceratodon purpureus]KAG0616738.1 hypothetical protein M758_5G138600 [Ceratodon purpureus]